MLLSFLGWGAAPLLQPQELPSGTLGVSPLSRVPSGDSPAAPGALLALGGDITALTAPMFLCLLVFAFELVMQNTSRDESPPQGSSTNFLMQRLLNIY